MDDIATKPPDVEPADAGAAPGFSISTTAQAVRWAEQGFYVFPCRPGEKEPATPNGFKDASNDPERVRELFAARPDFNIGLVPGRSGHVVVDVDSERAESELRDLWGQIPDTVSWTTKRGRHRLYRSPLSLRSRNGVREDLDVKANGGYVVVPPSIHPDGPRYAFEDGTTEVAPLTAEQAAELAPPVKNGATPPQENLRAPDVDTLRRVVGKIPNDYGRDGWIGIAYAIRAAACPENVEEGRDIFRTFSERWTDGTNTPEEIDRAYDTAAPSEGYRAGFGKLRDIANERSDYNPAADVFQADPGAEPDPSEEHTGFLSRIKTAAELIAEPRPPIEYVVGGKLARGRNSIVAAPPKCGKSTLMRSLVTAVAKGQDWLGMPTSQGRILYVALEEHKDDVASDLETFGADVENMDVYVGPSPDELPDAIQAAAADRGDYSLVIIDTIFRGVKTEDGNAYMETTASLDDVIHLAHDSGAHVLCVHHTRKGVAYTGGDPFEGILGSTGIWASFDAGMMYLPAAKLGDDYRRLITRGRRHVESDSRVVYQTPDGLLECAGTWTDVQAEQLYDHLRGHGPSTRDEMAAGLGWGKTTIRKYVAFLEDAGKVEQTGEGVKGDPYKWAVTDPTQSYDPDVTTVFSADTEAVDLSDMEGES